MPHATTIIAREQPSNRIVWIDCARIFAALLVVMVHTPLDTSFDYMDAVFLSAHVPCFYFLSGLFVKRSDWKHILQRVLFLLIPYLLWNNLTFLLQFGTNFHHLTLVNINQQLVFYFRQTVLSPADIPFWFLRNLIGYTLLIPVFASRPKTSLSVVVILIAVTQAGDNFQGLHLGRNVEGLIFFLLGMMMRQHKTALTHILQSYGSSILIAVIALSALAMWHHNLISITGQLAAVFGLLSLGVVTTKHLPVFSRHFSGMAESCFLLYAIHYPLILLCGWQESMYLPWWNYGYSFLFAISCLFLSYALYMGLRRYAPKILGIVAAVKS